MRTLFFGQLRPAEMEVSHVRILYPLLPCLGQPADIFILQIDIRFFLYNIAYNVIRFSIWSSGHGMLSLKLAWRLQSFAMTSVQDLWHFSRYFCF